MLRLLDSCLSVFYLFDFYVVDIIVIVHCDFFCPSFFSFCVDDGIESVVIENNIIFCIESIDAIMKMPSGYFRL